MKLRLLNNGGELFLVDYSNPVIFHKNGFNDKENVLELPMFVAQQNNGELPKFTLPDGCVPAGAEWDEETNTVKEWVY